MHSALKITSVMRIGRLAGLCCLIAMAVEAAPEVPAEGLKAEGEKRWDDAVQVYKEAIAEDANRGDLWLRIAQIESARGNTKAVVEAWKNASDLAPEDSGLLFGLAKASASAGDGGQALEAVGRALKLAPKNLEYLRARAMYANWIGNTDAAADSYRRILEENPDDEKALEGLKSVMGGNADAKDYARIAQNLEKEISASPNDPALRAELAQVYSMANEPARALEAIEKAVELAPKNVDYLRARGQYANWMGKIEIAEDSYLRIVAINPDDADATVNLARAKSWGGHLDESVDIFKKYIKAHPEDRDALMDYVKVQSWRGNYSAAMDGLETYKERFKETLEYRKQKARILASAGKSSAAEDVITQLLSVAPFDYEVYFSRAAAFHNARQRKEALVSLDSLEQMRPDSEENKELRRFITYGIRNSVKAAGEFYRESDSVEIETYTASGGAQLSPYFRAIAGYDLKYLSADEGSGLESLDGRDPITTKDLWAGVDWLVIPQIDLMGRAGQTESETITSESEDLDSFLYMVDVRLADALSVSYLDDKHIYTVSPRAVSQGIYRRNQSARLSWTPGLEWTVDASASQAKFSDGNREWEAYLAPRRAVIRSQSLNLDLGVFAWLQAFKVQEFNGYYAPELYERYALKANGYWKINDNNGVSMMLTAGLQRDETFSNFEFGGGGDVEGQFGLTPDWMLKLHAGFTQNLNSAAGDFDAQVYGASLERLF